jgi:hypothetical protein
MFAGCSHQWVECSDSLRELLRFSEYGGWRVDCLRFYVCSRCYQIKTKPRYELAPYKRLSEHHCHEEKLALPGVA